MKSFALTIILSLSVLAVLAQTERENSIENKKNSLLGTFGPKSHWFGINYERHFLVSKKHPLVLTAGVGVGSSMLRSISFPLYLDMGYGIRNRFYLTCAFVQEYIFDPDITNQEDYNDFLYNPESDYLLAYRPSLPYENYLVVGLGYRKTLDAGWFIQIGASSSFIRWPSYKSPKWNYVYDYSFLDVGIGKTF